jgi:hypothetical protein
VTRRREELVPVHGVEREARRVVQIRGWREREGEGVGSLLFGNGWCGSWESDSLRELQKRKEGNMRLRLKKGVGLQAEEERKRRMKQFNASSVSGKGNEHSRILNIRILSFIRLTHRETKTKSGRGRAFKAVKPFAILLPGSRKDGELGAERDGDRKPREAVLEAELSRGVVSENVDR